MRYTPKQLHPVIFKKIKKYSSQVMNSAGTIDPKVLEAMSGHSTVWIKEYWKGLVLWLLGMIPVFASVPLSKEILGKTSSVFVFFAMLILWGTVGAVLYSRNQELATLEELEQIRPVLSLSDYEALYLDNFIALQKCQWLDSSHKTEWCEALNASLDQAMRMEEVKRAILDKIGSQDAESLSHEVARLEGLRDQATDSIARATFEESIVLAKQRENRKEGVALQLQRIDANLELTRQTFLKTRDTFMQIDTSRPNQAEPSPLPLRQNLAKLQAESKIILDSVEELNFI